MEGCAYHSLWLSLEAFAKKPYSSWLAALGAEPSVRAASVSKQRSHARCRLNVNALTSLHDRHGCYEPPPAASLQDICNACPVATCSKMIDGGLGGLV